MSFGACDSCGCAFHECECLRAGGEPYTEQESEIVRDLVSSAAEATVHFSEDELEESARKSKVTQFVIHGTYLQDYRCFDMVKRLGVREAFEMLATSDWVPGEKPTTYIPTTDFDGQEVAYFLLNKGWVVINVHREKGYVDVIYNHDGKYSLRRAGLQAFLDRTEAQSNWSKEMRSLRERIQEGA